LSFITWSVTVVSFAARNPPNRLLLGPLAPFQARKGDSVTLLGLGLVLFLGTHLLPTMPGVRNALRERLGPMAYRGVFSLASLAGLVLIVVGYMNAGPREPLFAPWPAARALAPSAMFVAFVLFAAANMRGHIRRTLRHPMLLGTLLWSGIHLLANGDRAGTLLFGAFFAWALVDLISAIARGAVASFEPELKFDLMAIVGGALVAVGVAALHRVLFGVPVVPFGF
jgi:uncharacterized membrane protein